MNFQENKDRYLGRFGERKMKGKTMCYNNLKKLKEII